jgi:hypothetical protein
VTRHPLARILWRYSYAYTAAHDFHVCDELIADDYVLRMGDHELRGRDREYKPATQRQFRQFPTLGFTVHQLVLGRDRAALHFTEHGRSARTGTFAAWEGVSLYRFDGHRLTECNVEQDYYSRSRQLDTGAANPVAAPAVDPWQVEPADRDPATETAVRDWLTRGGPWSDGSVRFDDEHLAPRERVSLDLESVDVLDLVGAGPKVAFQIRARGGYQGGLAQAQPAGLGAPVTLYATGIAGVASDGSVDAKVISDRLAVKRRLSV